MKNKLAKKATCIIPAYNESQTIEDVIKTALQTPEIGEVIVINDGSKDNTQEIINRFKNQAKIIELKKNKGKGFAVVKGIKKSKYEYLLFLDADMINIKPYHLSSLIKPVLKDEVDMTLGPNVSLENPAIAFVLLPICGQRCLKKEFIIKSLTEIENSKYGIEVILNFIFRQERIAVVPLISHKKLHKIKTEKQNDWFVSYIREAWHIIHTSLWKRRKSTIKNLEDVFLNDLSKSLKISVEKVRRFVQEEI
ncbi:glycosyltransferase [Candidatus Dojkabacteria bacterium]|nr:glycosyltransferase [Candidatus Dojkabacteria bacterium]